MGLSSRSCNQTSHLNLDSEVGVRFSLGHWCFRGSVKSQGDGLNANFGEVGRSTAEILSISALRRSRPPQDWDNPEFQSLFYTKVSWPSAAEEAMHPLRVESGVRRGRRIKSGPEGRQSAGCLAEAPSVERSAVAKAPAFLRSKGGVRSPHGIQAPLRGDGGENDAPKIIRAAERRKNLRMDIPSEDLFSRRVDDLSPSARHRVGRSVYLVYMDVRAFFRPACGALTFLPS
jgi:hypothetical protein